MMVGAWAWVLTGTGLVWLALLLEWGGPRPRRRRPEVWPRVSVLVAARNESAHIEACVQSLLALDYPATRLDIWVGDDASEDDTALRVAALATRHPHLHLVRIHNHLDDLRGKANVLAQLARRAQGEFLLFTDADTTVPPEWAQTLLAYATPTVGLVAGVTTLEGRSPFACLQALDWLGGFAVAALLARLRYPVAAMGNNMLVRRTAYERLGGYAALPFSYTEDVALYRALQTVGWEVRHAYEPGALARSAAVRTSADWWQQRYRWLRGSWPLPWGLVVGLLVMGGTLPVALALALSTGGWAWVALGGYGLGVATWVGERLARVGQRSLLVWLLVFPAYAVWHYGGLGWMVLRRRQVAWKGRAYDPR